MDELRNIPLNDTVYLRDVATLKYEVEDPHHHTERWNGKASATVSIRKESEANTVEVSDRVAATVKQIQQDPALANPLEYAKMGYNKLDQALHDAGYSLA